MGKKLNLKTPFVGTMALATKRQIAICSGEEGKNRTYKKTKPRTHPGFLAEYD